MALSRVSGLWLVAIVAYCEHQLWVGVAASSIETRRSHLRVLARGVGVVDPWMVTAAQLRAWFSAQPWKTETQRSYRTTLRGFYRWAVEDGLTVRSPALGLPRVRPAAPNPRPAPDAVYQMAIAAGGVDERLMIRLAGELGMRRAEVAQVHTRDLVEDLDGWSLLVHGKGNRERLVPLPRRLSLELRRLPAGYAFPGQVDGHLSARWVGRRVNRLLPEGWTMHKLRHRAGTRWYEQSGDVLAVQELLGHGDPKVTRAYVKIPSSRLRAIVEAAA